MPIVVDASVAVRWCFKLDRSDRAVELARSNERLLAPDLLIPEFVNSAWKLVTQANAPAELAIDFARQIGRAFEELVPSLILKDRALALAIELRHRAYDCFYLALAERRECKLVTADDRLLQKMASSRYAALVVPL